MFFAAKEFVEKRATERGRRVGRRDGWQEGWREGWQEGWREGRQEGRLAERERIQREVAALGVPLPPELSKILADENE